MLNSYRLGAIAVIPIAVSLPPAFYSVIAGSPEKNSKIYSEMANNMVDFLTSSEIQELIGNYGVKDYGMQLFTPCAGNEPK